eukprot:GDKJ01025396.1.p2 GENE.GDKJ01025396.1~~GDKJ01025396.1.p2  ORF type:complete len:143 (+),score=30.46 GDKJ01025396.1:583-1011(+)
MSTLIPLVGLAGAQAYSNYYQKSGLTPDEAHKDSKLTTGATYRINPGKKQGDPQAQADPDELRQYPYKQQFKSSSPDRYHESTTLHDFDPDRFNTPLSNEPSDHMRPKRMPNKYISKNTATPPREAKSQNMDSQYLQKKRKM